MLKFCCCVFSEKDCRVIDGKDGIKVCRLRRVAFAELPSAEDGEKAVRANRTCLGKHCINGENFFPT